MATGLLGQSALAAATNTTVYTVPATTFTVLSINILNRGTTAVAVRVALAATGTPTNAEYIEFDCPVGSNGVLERTGIMMDSGKRLVVWASNANVSVNAFGIETSTV